MRVGVVAEWFHGTPTEEVIRLLQLVAGMLVACDDPGLKEPRRVDLIDVRIDLAVERNAVDWPWPPMEDHWLVRLLYWEVLHRMVGDG